MAGAVDRDKIQEKYGLTDKQIRFVEEYAAGELNATEAARQAEYSSPRAMGHENLTKPHISAAISEYVEPLARQAEINTEDLLEEYRRLAFSDVTNVVRWDERGEVTVIPSDELPPGVSASIKKLKWKEDVSENGVTRRLEVQMHAKTKPMEKLGQYLGLWTDPNEIRVQILQVFNQMSAEELAHIEQMDDDELVEMIQDQGTFRPHVGG